VGVERPFPIPSGADSTVAGTRPCLESWEASACLSSFRYGGVILQMCPPAPAV